MPWRILPVSLLALILTSCGSNPGGGYGGEDGKKVADLISGLDEALQRPKELGVVFAAGAAPKDAELKKFRGLSFALVGKPSVSRTTATAKVAVEKSSTGDKLGEKEWTFVKE